MGVLLDLAVDLYFFCILFVGPKNKDKEYIHRLDGAVLLSGMHLMLTQARTYILWHTERVVVLFDYWQVSFVSIFVETFSIN